MRLGVVFSLPRLATRLTNGKVLRKGLSVGVGVGVGVGVRVEESGARRRFGDDFKRVV